MRWGGGRRGSLGQAGPSPRPRALQRHHQPIKQFAVSKVTPAPPLRTPTPPPPQLTVAGKGEWLPQAVAQHGHLQVHLVPEMLRARGDSAPDIPGEGVVPDIRARSEAGQEERGRQRWTRRLLGPPSRGPGVPPAPPACSPPGLQARVGTAGKHLWETLLLTHLLQLQNVSQAELNIRYSSKQHSFP